MQSMIQNNILSTKIRIKSTWIRSISAQKYYRKHLGLKNVGPQCLFSKGEGVFGKMEGGNLKCKWKRGN